MLCEPVVVYVYQSPCSLLSMSSLSFWKPFLSKLVPVSRTVYFLLCMRRMSLVAVRSVKGEENLTISFSYGGKQRKMQRNKGEIVSKALSRIKLSIKKKTKMSRNSSGDCECPEENDQNVNLWFNGELIDTSLTNTAAWKDGATLTIGENSFTVKVNPPTMKSLHLPESIMSGFPVMPLMELEFSTKQHCIYTWFKSISCSEEKASSVPLSASEILSWEVVGNDFLYSPTILDIGCFLKLTCIPGNEDRLSDVKSDVTSLVTVSAGPGNCPFDTRHTYTNKPTDNPAAFRVVSYNILADTYSKDEFAQTVLYPYCPPYALNISYRRQLLLKEITGYNADLICLQECGVKLFHNNLRSTLEVLGFESLLRCKGGQVPEGEALFFRRSKFELISQHDVVLSEILLVDPVHEAILDHVAAMPILLETLQNRNTIAQVSVLKVTGLESHFLCVANTHLYFKPFSTHIRMIQGAIIINHVKQVISQFCKVNCEKRADLGIKPTCTSQAKVAFLLCGDLNSNPRAGLIEFLTTGEVKSTHRDWTLCEDKEEHCTTLSLKHDFDLISACGFPPYTNYTGGFKGTLDYVFVDKEKLQVEAVIPMPSEEELNCHVALPSVVVPSDHLALVCDLKWKL